jgi:hypothetical protein
MTMRSLAVVSVVLAVGAVSPSAAETKVISGPLPTTASVVAPGAPAAGASAGLAAPPAEFSVDTPASPTPALEAAPGIDAGAGAKSAADAVLDAPPDPGIGAVEAARIADPPQSSWRRMLSALMRFAPAASR